MTKEEYLSFGNEQFLSEEDKDAEKQRNSNNHYGLSSGQLLTLSVQHKVARNSEDYKTMALIEYRLTDINFHWECGKMHSGEYDVLRRWLRGRV